jgi:uncharacterized protein YndB with AHSA1/START domain
MAWQQSYDLTTSGGYDSDVEVQLEAAISGEIRTTVVPAIVSALLTDAQHMMSWLAQEVIADPRPGGVLRLANFSGLWVEGLYLEVIAHRIVVFSWGGIEGLRRGQSTVDFTLQREENGTLVRLWHNIT